MSELENEGYSVPRRVGKGGVDADLLRGNLAARLYALGARSGRNISRRYGVESHLVRGNDLKC
jgi:hypothetical protein